MLHTWTLSVLWVKTKFIVCRKMLMLRTSWWFLFYYSFKSLLYGAVWFNGQCLSVVSKLFNFLFLLLVWCRFEWAGMKQTKFSHILISRNILTCKHAVMSWICTKLSGKLAKIPSLVWKFSCRKFSPLNNDYVVQLPEFLPLKFEY